MGEHDCYPLLAQIACPADLRRLESPRLTQVAKELRTFLLHTIAGSGGHLGAGLGAVELAVALHYVYRTPRDRIVWDTGHQSYPHKVLTRRREQLSSIRKWDGLAPFPRRAESDYDAFGVGHAGTSISAALGMALAAKQYRHKRQSVAVIGDGAMTAGMAFEALDHAGALEVDLLVVLNANEMSISPNVGALNNHLARCAAGAGLDRSRQARMPAVDFIPPTPGSAGHDDHHAKQTTGPGELFCQLGFDYHGPVDGHDVQALVQALRHLRSLTGPRLLHVVTTKGKGYAPAEADRVAYHGVAKFDVNAGLAPARATTQPTYSAIFGQWLCDMAAVDQRLVAITPAMCEGSGLSHFARQYPQRYFDVAIAEQHAVTLAAGMASDGLKPVVAIYSTFLQRAYDQVVHDVAVQNLPVLFAIDRAGLVGADGPTHQGCFDFSLLRCVPHLVLMAPADENECRQMLYTASQLEQPAAVRYPRGAGPGASVEQAMQTLEIGRAQVRRCGQHVALLAFGAMVTPAEAAAQALNATLVNMRFVKPLDEDLIVQVASQHDRLVTVEDQMVAGGAGSAVSECLARRDLPVRIMHLGVVDEFIEHGTREEQLNHAGLDGDGIERSIRDWLEHRSLTASADERSPGGRQSARKTRHTTGCATGRD